MYRYKNLKFSISLFVLIIIATHSGCRKFVQVGTPPDKITQANVYSTDRSATTALTGIYAAIVRSGIDMSEYGGLLADEWNLWNGAGDELRAYYTNFLSANDKTINTGKEIWELYYRYIFRCNAALEGILNNNNLSKAVQQQLSGEAYFLRAWFNFYLLNLYGDIPLPQGTDPEKNRLLPRSSAQAVYELIINDLLKAQELLSAEYVDGQLKPYSGIAERVRPSKWAATAFLARVYLYTGEWVKAEAEASIVIAQTELFSLLPLGDIFLKNSREAIWQIQPVDVGWNTWEGRSFHLLAPPAGFSFEKPVYLNTFLLNTFELNDQRRTQWVDSLIEGNDVYYFPVKYKVGEQTSFITSADALTEYSMMLRLSELYLIRAEARARQNNLADAVTDLDILRDRAELPLIADTNPGISQESLLEAIIHERQVELFTEWGHRWFDLKRINKINDVMSIVTPIKGGSWQATAQLLPVPYDELLSNPNLSQNPGY